jgi:hypothetical protein
VYPYENTHFNFSLRAWKLFINTTVKIGDMLTTKELHGTTVTTAGSLALMCDVHGKYVRVRVSVTMFSFIDILLW